MAVDAEPITMRQATLVHELAEDRAVELNAATIQQALADGRGASVDPWLERERRELLQAREQIDRRLAELDQLLQPTCPQSWSGLARRQASGLIDWLKRQPIPDLYERVAAAISEGPAAGVEPILLDVACGHCKAEPGTPCFTKFGEVRWGDPHKPRIELAGAEQLVEDARDRRRQARTATGSEHEDAWAERTEMDVPAPDSACPSCAAQPGEPCVNRDGRITASMHQPRALIAGVPATNEAACGNVALWVSCREHGRFTRYENAAPLIIPADKTFGTCPHCSTRLTFDGWCNEQHQQLAAAALANT